MADLRISELIALSGADLAGEDLLLVSDLSASESKKITVTDFAGKAVTLIADATLPSGKILFNSQTVAGSALVDSGVTAAKLASGSVTAAKMAANSSCRIVNELPIQGDYVGQMALDAIDNELYVWDGSVWVTLKAPGSINAIVGGTSGIVNIEAIRSGDEVLIRTNIDDTTAASQFLAGPSNAAGTPSFRTITGADLPVASDTERGAVQVNGNGLTMSSGAIAIDNTVAANTSAFHLVQYTGNGLISSGREIQAGDLPVAGSSTVGGVKPGTGMSVAVDGALNHTNAVTPGTATKVSYDGQGHVTTGTSLSAADIPEIPAEKLTSGIMPIDRIGTNAITGAKLGNASTVKFGGAGSTTGIVTFPTPEFTGQYFWDASNGDLYLYDGNTWQPVTITSGELIFAGTYDASTNQVDSITTAGGAAGLTVGGALPAASDTNSRYYVVVSESGTGSSPAPAESLAPPDMLLSNGSTWELIDVSNAIAGQTAGNISFTPYGNLTSNNVQTAVQELDDEKLARAGGTVTGELRVGPTGSLVFEGATDDAFETTLAVADPTADRTITLPNQSGSVIVSGNASIVDADISASAAISDTKLATISTAGKVANSATTATSANTTSAIVARDGSGNFSAGTISAALSGNASTATALQTARTIQGVSFDGTANITVATAGTGISVTGTAIANTGVLSVNGATGAITNVAVTNTAQSFTAAQRGAISALTDGATITPDFAVANNFSVTLGGNRTLANPTNLTAGQSGVIYITQDGTGSRTLAYGSAWDFAGGTAPTLSTAANAVDCLAYAVRTTGSIAATLIKDVK